MNYFMRLPSFRLPVLSALVVSALFPSVNAAAQEVNPAGRSFPLVSLPRPVPASELAGRANARIPEMAEWYGYGEAEFRKMLKEERSMRADKLGYLHYVCAGLVAPSQGAVGAAATVTQPTYPLADTFKLHSRPGASKVIYLDFDGHVTSRHLMEQQLQWRSRFHDPAL
jgi:hypothetical protein